MIEAGVHMYRPKIWKHLNHILVYVVCGNNRIIICKLIICQVFGQAKRAPHWGVQSRFRVIYIGMSVCLRKTMQKVCMSKNVWAKFRGPNTPFWAVKIELKANRASEIEEQWKERLDKTRK